MSKQPAGANALIGPRGFALMMISIGLVALVLSTIEHRRSMTGDAGGIRVDSVLDLRHRRDVGISFGSGGAGGGSPASLGMNRTSFHLLAKPTGAVCNLDCKYCFFLSKEMLYPGSRFQMADDLLRIYIRQLLESQAGPEVIVGWQGGEPTLMGLDFFERSIEYVERFRRPGQQVTYTIQTNGTKLNDDWCAFFKQHKFLVGLSIDGPARAARCVSR